MFHISQKLSKFNIRRRMRINAQRERIICRESWKQCSFCKFMSLGKTPIRYFETKRKYSGKILGGVWEMLTRRGHEGVRIPELIQLSSIASLHLTHYLFLVELCKCPPSVSLTFASSLQAGLSMRKVIHTS